MGAESVFSCGTERKAENVCFVSGHKLGEKQWKLTFESDKESDDKNEIEWISKDHTEKDIRTCGHPKLQKYEFPEW